MLSICFDVFGWLIPSVTSDRTLLEVGALCMRHSGMEKIKIRLLSGFHQVVLSV